jgi:hypothetical protein
MGPEKSRPPCQAVHGARTAPTQLAVPLRVRAAEPEPVVDLLEDVQQMVDLLGGVGGGQLDADAGFLAGDHRVGGEGHVDAAAVGVVHVQQGVVLAGQGGEGRQGRTGSR